MCTYGTAPGIMQPLARHLSAVPLELLDPVRSPILALAGLTGSGWFDLLGSGWHRVFHGMDCPGVAGHVYRHAPVQGLDRSGAWLEARMHARNFAVSRRIWQLIPGDYEAIDWQLDFRSGWRYDERTWSEDLIIDGPPGADVKVPWELARMQHLPWLAHAYRLCMATGDATVADRHVVAFRSQILDFIATNPPRFGVNWRGTMDVAIRLVNWLVAHDLFRANGVVFDPEFEGVLERSILAHAMHVRHHLEWHPVLKGNHYLCGLAGLFFAAAYLPSSRQTRAWLAFSWTRLLRETAEQFLEDGGNFESSTCYHRLSTETVVYATALMASVLRTRPDHAPGLAIPEAHLRRIERMALFTEAICWSDGRVPQVGDNDSGRFLKLVPPVVAMSVSEAQGRYANLATYRGLPDDAIWWDEDFLDHRHLIAAVAGLMGRPRLDAWLPASCLEARVLADLAGGIVQPASRSGVLPLTEYGDEAAWQEGSSLLETLPDRQKRSRRYALSSDTRSTVVRTAFPAFGLFVFRSAAFHAIVRCGPVGQRGWGAHAHNDQLMLDLEIDGRHVLADPGSYLYTPAPAERNRYRSARAHNGPRVGSAEPGDLDQGLFRLVDRARARCLYFGERGFLGAHEGFGVTVYRRVLIDGGEIRVDDCFDGPNARVAGFAWAPEEEPPPFSPKYGCQLR